MSFETDLIDIQPKLLFQAWKFYRNSDIQAAEDLVGDTVERILKNKDKFEEGTNFNAWCFFILKNNFINDYRSIASHRKYCVDNDLDNENVLSILNHEQADDTVRFNDLMKLVESMSKTIREPFLMSLDGFKYEEIAEKFQVPVGTIKSRIFKAREFLQKRINKESNNLITIKTYNNLKEENEMAPRKIDKSSQLAKFFQMVYETSNNHWTSVKDFPLTPMYRDCGLDHNWGAAINHVLKNTKFFMIEGERSGMRYRSYNAVTPDFDALAQQVIDFKATQPATPKSDLTPKVYSTPDKAKVIKTEIIKGRKHFNVDDVCYAMHKNAITEFDVIAVERVQDGSYYHRLMNKEIIMEDMANNQCFSSPESLAAYLVKHTAKLK